LLILLFVYSKEFFKEASEVIDVRLAKNDEGGLKGFGHVEFVSAEAAQKVGLRYQIPSFAQSQRVSLTEQQVSTRCRNRSNNYKMK